MHQKQSIADLAVMGGTPLFQSVRMTGQLSAPDVEDYIRAAGEFRPEGGRDFVGELEAALADRHGVQHCIAVTNACLGLLMLLSLNRASGKNQVLLPSFSYRGLPHLVRWAGQHPVFCDVTPEGHTLCPQSVERMIDKQTSSILCVHNVNALCDIQALQRLADRHSAALVMDSVYALDCELNGQRVGTFGQAEVFSLHATKLLHGFEGGYITTNHGQLDHWLRQLRDNQPVHRDGLESVAGIDARLHPLHAACALISLDRLEATKASNASRYRRYLNRFERFPHLSFASYSNRSSNHGLVLLRVEDAFPFSRDEIVKLLRAENALVRPYYDPPLHVSGARPGDRVDDELTVTERVRRQFIQMPVGDFVSLDDIDELATFFRFLLENEIAIRGEMDASSSTPTSPRPTVREATKETLKNSKATSRIHAGPDIEYRIRDIFDRRFYANHGPLESEVEQAIADLLQVKFVNVVANDMLALVFALRAVATEGEVVLPAFAPSSTVHAAMWAGFEPILIDMPAASKCLRMPTGAVYEETRAMIAIRRKDTPCDITALNAFAEQNQIAVILDAREPITSHSQLSEMGVGGTGIVTVLSFGEGAASGVLGGAVATNSEEVSKRIRTMRSFHAQERFFGDCLRMNGKISELQAAMILSSLEEGHSKMVA